MEIIQTKPELDSYPMTMLHTEIQELPDIFTFIAVRSVNEGVPEIVDPVEVEAQNEVPAEEHGFCLLDMDKGSLQQLPSQQYPTTRGSATTVLHMTSHHNQQEESDCGVCGLDNCPPVVSGRPCTRCATVPVHSYSQGGRSSHDEEGLPYLNTGHKTPYGCGKTFHIELECNKLTDRPYQCQVCGKRFTQPGVLKTHSLIHKGERPFTCEVCNKRFLLAWHLRRHALTHSGVKPYACDLCGKEFNQSSNLKRHFPTHSREKVRRNAQTLGYS